MSQTKTFTIIVSASFAVRTTFAIAAEDSLLEMNSKAVLGQSCHGVTGTSVACPAEDSSLKPQHSPLEPVNLAHSSFPVDALKNEEGQPWSPESEKASFHLLIFGYPRCLERCSLALQALATILHRSGKDVTRRLQVHFVDISLENPDGSKAREFARVFLPEARGLSVEHEGALTRLAESLQTPRAFLEKVPKSQRGELPRVLHPDVLVMLSNKGEELSRVPLEMGPGPVSDWIGRLVTSAPKP